MRTVPQSDQGCCMLQLPLSIGFWGMGEFTFCVPPSPPPVASLLRDLSYPHFTIPIAQWPKVPSFALLSLFSGPLSCIGTHLIDLFVVLSPASGSQNQKDFNHSMIHSLNAHSLSSKYARHSSEQGTGALTSWNLHSKGRDRQKLHK